MLFSFSCSHSQNLTKYQWGGFQLLRKILPAKWLDCFHCPFSQHKWSLSAAQAFHILSDMSSKLSQNALSNVAMVHHLLCYWSAIPPSNTFSNLLHWWSNMLYCTFGTRWALHYHLWKTYIIVYQIANNILYSRNFLWTNIYTIIISPISCMQLPLTQVYYQMLWNKFHSCSGLP